MRKLIVLTALLTFSPALAQEAPAAKPAVAAAEAKATEAPSKPAEAPKAEAPAATAAAPAAAPAEDLSPQEVVALGKTILDAAKGGNWGIVVASVLMLLLWVLRKFVLKKIPSSYMPWVAAGTGVAGAVAANLQAGQPWMDAVMSGFMAGAAASGLYSLVGKKLLGGAPAAPAKEEEPAEEDAGSSSEAS